MDTISGGRYQKPPHNSDAPNGPLHTIIRGRQRPRHAQDHGVVSGARRVAPHARAQIVGHLPRNEERRDVDGVGAVVCACTQTDTDADIDIDADTQAHKPRTS